MSQENVGSEKNESPEEFLAEPNSELFITLSTKTRELGDMFSDAREAHQYLMMRDPQRLEFLGKFHEQTQTLLVWDGNPPKILSKQIRALLMCYSDKAMSAESIKRAFGGRIGGHQIRRALNVLYNAGKLDRLGQGTKRWPFLYRLKSSVAVPSGSSRLATLSDRSSSTPPLFGAEEMRKRKVTVRISQQDFDLLGAIAEPSDVLSRLADHAAQGIRREGAWESGWVRQCFGDEFEKNLEVDPISDGKSWTNFRTIGTRGQAGR